MDSDGQIRFVLGKRFVEESLSKEVLKEMKLLSVN